MAPKLILVFLALLLAVGSFWPHERARFSTAVALMLYIIVDQFVTP